MHDRLVKYSSDAELCETLDHDALDDILRDEKDHGVVRHVLEHGEVDRHERPVLVVAERKLVGRNALVDHEVGEPERIHFLQFFRRQRMRGARLEMSRTSSDAAWTTAAREPMPGPVAPSTMTTSTP